MWVVMSDNFGESFTELCGDSELCDQCGHVVPDAPIYAVVPDSSYASESDPSLDGGRLVVACCGGHLLALWRRYRDRPFDPEELWAARVLARRTDLTPQQHAAGLRWLHDHQSPH